MACGARELNRVKSKWPAIILAARRTARVNGRITLLINSIMTIKAINGPGVPSGTKCANARWGLLYQLNIMWPSHNGKASVTVNERWLEAVKMYGNNPRLLFKRMNTHRHRGRSVKVWGVHFLINAASSPWILWVIRRNLCRKLDEAHITGGINISPTKHETQLIATPPRPAGSNTEKRFLIWEIDSRFNKIKCYRK